MNEFFKCVALLQNFYLISLSSIVCFKSFEVLTDSSGKLPRNGAKKSTDPRREVTRQTTINSKPLAIEVVQPVEFLLAIEIAIYFPSTLCMISRTL